MVVGALTSNTQDGFGRFDKLNNKDGCGRFDKLNNEDGCGRFDEYRAGRLWAL